MLHWIYFFTYVVLCLFASFYYINKSFLSLIILFELILVYIFFLGLLISSYFNVYFIAAFGFILLVFAGLEVALNIMIYLLKWTGLYNFLLI